MCDLRGRGGGGGRQKRVTIHCYGASLLISLNEGKPCPRYFDNCRKEISAPSRTLLLPGIPLDLDPIRTRFQGPLETPVPIPTLAAFSSTAQHLLCISNEQTLGGWGLRENWNFLDKIFIYRS